MNNLSPVLYFQRIYDSLVCDSCYYDNCCDDLLDMSINNKLFDSKGSFIGSHCICDYRSFYSYVNPIYYEFVKFGILI